MHHSILNLEASCYFRLPWRISILGYTKGVGTRDGELGRGRFIALIFPNIIKKRTDLVNQVLLTKKFKNEIIDRKRIKKILNNIKIKSQKRKIDKKITNAIWKAMIRAYIQYEFRNFKK